MLCSCQHLTLLTGVQIAVNALHCSKKQSIMQLLLSKQGFLKTAIRARLEPALMLKRTATLHHNQKHRSNKLMTASRGRHVHRLRAQLLSQLSSHMQQIIWKGNVELVHDSP